MVYTQRYPTHIPVPLTQEAADALGLGWPVDEELLNWLVAESCDRKARAEALELVEFIAEGEVDRRDIPPNIDEQIAALGVDPAEFVWHRFIGVAQRPALINWLGAEAVYKAGQEALAEARARLPAALAAQSAPEPEPEPVPKAPRKRKPKTIAPQEESDA